MPQIVEIRDADDSRAVIHRACQLLVEGQVVAFPTETSYVVAASSLSPAGLQRLGSLAPAGIVLTLKSVEEAQGYLSKVPVAADKLGRRAWPGPLTMEFAAASFGELFHQLLEPTRILLAGSTSHVGLRVVTHEIFRNVQQLVPGPLLINADRGTRGSLSRTAADVVQQYGDAVSLIIDDGPCRYGEPTSTIRFEGEQWILVELGMISALNLDRLTSEIYLFVCTGNTCRSPMAESLFRRRLSERLRCSDDDLMDRGFAVLSAGLSAEMGVPASEQAIAVLKNEGIDLLSHESQPVTSRLLRQADHILPMTRGHLQTILGQYPELILRVRMLSQDRTDIFDPYGGDLREYQGCKAQIERSVLTLINQLSLNS